MVGVGICATASPAAASDDEVLAAVFVGVGAVDLSFVVRDSVLFAQDKRESFRPNDIAEVVWNAPQAAIFHGMLGALYVDEGEEAFAGLHVPVMITSATTAHGAWSLAAPDAARSTRFLGSTAFGVNAALSTAAISMYFTDRNHSQEIIGVYMAGLSLANGSASFYLSVEDPAYRTMWLAQGAWSSLLVLHGVAAAFGAFEDVDFSEMASVTLAPGSMGAPFPGAPETPGLSLTGTF